MPIPDKAELAIAYLNKPKYVAMDVDRYNQLFEVAERLTEAPEK